jgi:antitoxin FitA
MPTAITLKNIPDELYDRLKAAAKEHHRSINNEAIVCLEGALVLPKQITPEERIARARAISEGLQAKFFDHALIDEFKNEGRS